MDQYVASRSCRESNATEPLATWLRDYDWLRALFVLFIAVNSSISATFQMAFMAKNCMLLTIAFKSLACVQAHWHHTHISAKHCLPAVSLRVIWKVVALSVKRSVKGLSFSGFYILRYIYEVLIAVAKTLK